MPRKKDIKRTLEQRVEAMTISDPPEPPPSAAAAAASSSSSSSSSSRPDRENLSWLENLIRNRESFDAIVTKHIFDKLKKSGVLKHHIVEILVETGCPLDFALLMEDADVTRMLLERKQTISRNESGILVELAMRSSYLGNIRPLVKYGPGAVDRREMFATRMYDMINCPKANLASARSYVEELMEADAIDDHTLLFLEKTLETGKLNAIKMLLDCRVDEHVRKRLGDDILVHLFGNVNVDVVAVLRGRRFDVNAKCGEMGALHFATLARSERNVRILLNAGADPNIRDCHGMTPLFAFGDRKCIELLLQNGADVQAVADNGYAILDMMFAEDLLEIMLAHVALVEARGSSVRKEIRDRIVAKSRFCECYDECCRQIETMAELRIHDGFKLLTALVDEPERIARFVVSQETVAELTRECRELKMHSYYLATIERNVQKAFVVFNLRFRAADVLLSIVEKFGFDEVIVERIVAHLAFEDLILYV